MMKSFDPEHLISLRRDLHAHPELSGHEVATAARIAEELAGGPFEIRTGVGGYGVIAELAGALPGPTLAYRADMDALPIDEASDVPYRSCRPGVMHACGHDVHVAVGVGIALTLADQVPHLHGRVRFIFQPAEEAPPQPGVALGAEAMVREGALDGVDAVFALHCNPDLEAGRIGHGVGGVFSASDVLTVRIHGRSAHGAYPFLGVDAIYLASLVVQALVALPPRFVDPRKPCVLSLGTMRAGTAHNILADQAEMHGSLRTFDPDVRDTARAAIRKLVREIPEAFGGRGEVDIEESTQAVLNHPRLQACALAYLEGVLGVEGLVPLKPFLGSEDFFRFSQRVPGCYLFLGVRNESRNIDHAIHTSEFDVDESCIPLAAQHLSGMLAHLAANWSDMPTLKGAP